MRKDVVAHCRQNNENKLFESFNPINCTIHDKQFSVIDIKAWSSLCTQHFMVPSLSFGNFFFFLCLPEHLFFLLGCTEPPMTVHSDFLNSSILILVLFHEQTKFQNILRNCLKYCGEIKSFFSPQTRIKIFNISMLTHFIFLHWNEMKIFYWKPHDIAAVMILECLVRPDVLELLFLPEPWAAFPIAQDRCASVPWCFMGKMHGKLKSRSRGTPHNICTNPQNHP